MGHVSGGPKALVFDGDPGVETVFLILSTAEYVGFNELSKADVLPPSSEAAETAMLTPESLHMRARGLSIEQVDEKEGASEPQLTTYVARGSRPDYGPTVVRLELKHERRRDSDGKLSLYSRRSRCRPSLRRAAVRIEIFDWRIVILISRVTWPRVIVA